MIKERLNRLPLFHAVNVAICRKKWRRENPHNFTEMGDRLFDRRKVTVGRGTYGPLNVWQFEKNCRRLMIGNYCSIAPQVSFLVDGEHPYTGVTTYPFASRYFQSTGESESKGDIVVEDDVWLGYRVTVLSGAHIGRGAVVAAGAVVTGTLEPYGIYGGVPARLIKKRFEDEVIRELMALDYSRIEPEQFRRTPERFTQPVTPDNAAQIVDALQGGTR